MFTQLPVGFTDAWKRVQPCPEQIIFPVLITNTACKKGRDCDIIFPVLATTTTRKKDGSCDIILPVLATTTTRKKGRGCDLREHVYSASRRFHRRSEACTTLSRANYLPRPNYYHYIQKGRGCDLREHVYSASRRFYRRMEACTTLSRANYLADT